MLGTDTDYREATSPIYEIWIVDPAWGAAGLEAGEVDQVVAGGSQTLIGTVEGVGVAGLGGRRILSVAVGPDADDAIGVDG